MTDKRIRLYRVGKAVFRMPRELVDDCRRYGITDIEIKKQYNEYKSLGIDVPFRIAAMRVLEDKKRARYPL